MRGRMKSSMNKSQSKYFNTAVKMDEALLSLLEKKDFEYITIKEICEEYSLKQIKDVIYQAYNNHVQFEWKTKAGKSSIEFYNLKTILKPDKFKKYLEQYEEG